MNAFLSALGGKLAEKWLSLLVLPGALYLAVVAAAVILRHHRPFEIGLLRETMDRVAASPASSSPGAILLTAAGILAAATFAGLTVSALGRGIERLWYAEGTGVVGRLRIAWRRRRWDAADARLHRSLKAGPAARRKALRAQARRDRIGRIRPHGPSWIGDGVFGVEQRIRHCYAMQLGQIWPLLWLVVPDQCRAEITAARDAQAASARLSAWAVLYLVAGAVWWPAVPVAVVLAVTARFRARDSAVNLADLVSGAVDLHGRELATRLGVAAEGPFTRDTGAAVEAALRGGVPE
ncbi:hypothetical protein [Amycolatopsis pithecellobii]|uniref:Uncharacterized protein n=1 Tax=Amycolatopsis pithecellobii TaxID=664692 RepID=A0A6N7Z7Y8_9PSEU|nr:hypothetical protein [Amycolatopsis pithecellobii]MTD57554.1 hypothetical protein [Amycolatopsis pithecellobii]